MVRRASGLFAASLCACRVGFDPVVAVDDANAGNDASGLDCPADYMLTVPGSPSRYKIDLTEQPLAAHHRACAADLPGSTHLVTVSSVDEVVDLGPALDAVPQPNQSRFYVGALQPNGQPTLVAGWIGFDGAPVPSAAWRADEPNDLDGVEDDTEQRATIGTPRFVLDVSGGSPYAAICECDGVPIAAEILAILPL